MMNDKRSDYQEVMNDVYENFPIHIFLKRKINGQKQVMRYIDSVIAVDSKGKQYKIYNYKNGEHIYHHFPKQLLELFGNIDDELFITKFGGGRSENN